MIKNSAVATIWQHFVVKLSEQPAPMDVQQAGFWHPTPGQNRHLIQLLRARGQCYRLGVLLPHLAGLCGLLMPEPQKP